MKKKTTAWILALLCGASFVGCAPIDEEEGGYVAKYNIDGKDKTKITVYNFDGGVGTDWLREAADRFAYDNLETKYAPDKKGIYIDITGEQGPDPIFASLPTQAFNILLSERRVYCDVLAASGALLDITDIVQDETRVGGSLESKIFSQAKASLMYNGRYYGVPHYEFYSGLSYDREMFDDVMAYFAAEDEEDVYEFESKYSETPVNMVGSLDAKKSLGPDGRTGTIGGVDYSNDDGLPCSLEELLILMDYLKNDCTPSISPVVLSGMYKEMSNYLLAGLWPSLAGYEQMTNYYNCTGPVEIVTGYTSEPLFYGINYIYKPQTQVVNLTEETGYKGSEMAAKYYATALLEIMQREGFYAAQTYAATVRHYDAQKALIYGGNVPQAVYDKCAMLIEGSYWYNESVEGGCFTAYEEVSDDREERDLRWMPLPTSFYTADQKAEGFEPRSSALLDDGCAYAVINANIKDNPEVLQACKEFFAFLYSDAELRNFTKRTGVARSISYSLNEDELKGMSSYNRNLWEIRDNLAGSNVVYRSSNTPTGNNAKITLAPELAGRPFVSAYQGVGNYFSAFQQTLKDDDDDNLYKYGTKACFEASKLTADTWKAFLAN